MTVHGVSGWRRAAILLLAVASMAQTRTVDPLSAARAAYNEQDYDRAVALAEELLAHPEVGDSAGVVAARARLERYRLTAEADDLQYGRDMLKRVDASKLASRDQIELLIGLGEALYLDDQFEHRYSAAAEQFELALARRDELDPLSRDLLFDWWALALDRQAQQGLESERRPLYGRIVVGAEEELARQSSSMAASYWLAAGARGVDDLSRAFGAAVAGWIRAGSLGPRGDALRADLDRLVMRVILPERARQLAAGGDVRLTLSYLTTQWEQVKAKWGSADS